MKVIFLCFTLNATYQNYTFAMRCRLLMLLSPFYMYLFVTDKLIEIAPTRKCVVILIIEWMFLLILVDLSVCSDDALYYHCITFRRLLRST